MIIYITKKIKNQNKASQLHLHRKTSYPMECSTKSYRETSLIMESWDWIVNQPVT